MYAFGKQGKEIFNKLGSHSQDFIDEMNKIAEKVKGEKNYALCIVNYELEIRRNLLWEKSLVLILVQLTLA